MVNLRRVPSLNWLYCRRYGRKGKNGIIDKATLKITGFEVMQMEIARKLEK